MKPEDVRPLAVTDKTALALVGMNARQFRTFVHTNAIPFVKAGRRMLVRSDYLLAAFDRLSGAVPAPWSEEDVIAHAAGTNRERGRR